MSHTFRFGLLGYPVKHSLSPVMHKASFRSLGIDADYQCFEVAPASLAERVEECRRKGFTGLNMTVPHKVAAVSLMNQLDLSACLFGAVNTVRIDSRGMKGYNTDADGFLEDLSVTRRMTPEGRSVLVIGCGGAGRALAIACVSRGAATVMLANRTVSKAEQLAEDLSRLLPNASAEVRVLPNDLCVWTERCLSADLVIQCTTAGLQDDDRSVLPQEAFRRGQLLYDIVYTRRITPTMGVAMAAGADAVNGVGMLVYQGASAFNIWTGLEADTSAMRAALEAHVYGG